MRAVERIGVHRDEEVRLHLARFFDALVQRQVEIAVARKERAHVRLGVDQRFQAARHHQRNVLLARAQPADGARILAAVPGIDDDDRESRDARFLGLLDQREQRVDRRRRINIEYQTVAVLGDRLQHEHLRPDLGLEVEHDADHPRAVARDAQALHIRIVRRDLGVQLGERRGDVGGLDVEHQARGILDAEDTVLQLVLRFEREPRVIACWPDPARGNLRLRRA